ncbi:MAG: DUF5916 domain-containing protein [Gemmatimonadaceae bacterium]
MVSTLAASRREGAIVLDGNLEDAAWQRAAIASEQFTQSWPNPGKPGTERTEVRVLYDDDAIYVGARMFDSRPDSIAAQLARRDAGGIYSDWAHVIIDSYHDRRTAFRFTVNPKGVQKDVFTSNDNQEDTNWDAVWDVATRVDSLGWVAEYRIPLSQLRFGTVSGERVWGFQFMRDIARRNERVSFNPWTPDGSGFVSRMGQLTGLVNLSQPQRLEVLPYVSAKVTREPGDAADPFFKKTDAEPNMGADVRYGLPGGLTLTGTLNPDFGQVEVDPATVNLTAFETFFPEKRPFFLEGADVFSFGQLRRHNDYGGQTFFYTRRIGRAPSRYPSGTGIQFVDMPEQTRIAGAAKVSGRKGPWTIGIMDALTAEERARVAGPTGAVDSATIVEPMSNFFAGRLRRDFRKGRTVVGSMLTVVNRQQSDLFRDMLSGSAGFGGLDFEHSWKNNTYVVSGFALGSRVNASPTVIDAIQRAPAHYFQRPDAKNLVYDPNRKSLTGHYNEIAIAKNGAWFGSLALKDVSPTFEINDVGFHGRVDYRAVSPFWGYQSNEKKKWTQNYFAGVWSNYAWNYDGTQIFNAYGGSTSATFNNMWGANLGGNIAPRYYSDRLLRGGPLAYQPSYFSVNANFWTDQRRRIWTNPYTNYQRYADGAWNASGGLWTEMRPSTTVRVTFNPSLSQLHSKSQYVRAVSDALADATYDTRYVFANLDQTTLVLETRVEWTFTPKLSLQSYIQPFVAVGEFGQFKEFTTPRGYDFAVYGQDRGTIAPGTDANGAPIYTIDPDDAGAATSFTVRNPNFNSHSLRGNAVLRWEYRPGSTLFFVWQQQREGAESSFAFEPGRDVGAIFRERPTNVFMLKAAYWLSK